MGGKFKIVMLGDEMSGKKALSNVSERKHTQPVATYKPTIGVEYFPKYLNLKTRTTHNQDNQDENNVTLQIWCAAGHERFRSIVRSYIIDAKALIIAVDLTNEKSIADAMKPWMDMVTAQYPDEKTRPPIILVGTKSDSRDVKPGKIQALKTYAEENNYPCYITSSKNNTCVDIQTNQTSKVDHFSNEDASTNEVSTEDTFFTKVAHICVAHEKKKNTEDAKVKAKSITYQELYTLANTYLESQGNKSVHSRALATFIHKLTLSDNGKRIQQGALPENQYIQLYLMLKHYMNSSQGVKFKNSKMQLMQPVFILY